MLFGLASSVAPVGLFRSRIVCRLNVFRGRRRVNPESGGGRGAQGLPGRAADPLGSWAVKRTVHRGGLDSMPFVPELLAQAVVLDAGGEARAVGDLWAERPAVIVFLRHFG